MSAGTAAEHVCFDCHRQIGSGEKHIHAGLDAACASLGMGLKPLGLDDVLTFAFCKACTKRGGPFEFHGHEVGGTS